MNIMVIVIKIYMCTYGKFVSPKFFGFFLIYKLLCIYTVDSPYHDYRYWPKTREIETLVKICTNHMGYRLLEF